MQAAETVIPHAKLDLGSRGEEWINIQNEKIWED
jgi:hypothetical protein